MENFPIVLAMLRASVRDKSSAVLQHAERLQGALKKAGALDEAQAIADVLEGSKKSGAGKLIPSRVVRSRFVSSGEMMSPNTSPPVDKETSAPLAEIFMPGHLEELAPPILSDRLERAISHLQEQWAGADQLQAAGIKIPRTALFFGPPGTGKTRLALWAASKLGLPVVLARLDGLTSSFLGTTARNIRALFDFANRYQCLLLLDEFDGIAKLRDDPQELGEVKRVVNAVLQAIDARAPLGLTIAITNHEALLDPAVWRRFDARIEIGLPDATTRLQIIERYTEGFAIKPGAVKVLAWLTEGYSGSDIETMCDFIKRHMTLRAGQKPSVIDSVQLFLDLSATNAPSAAREAILRGESSWMHQVLTYKDIKIVQADIADAIHSTQSKVSRRLKSTERA
ncbi:AAA family ATPase [Pseudomonas sp. 22082]|jgi:MoxR-like ATPase|uniref:AAA family ATPase n=1 Tax=unclassified Pseudomonas TaxID=196821 RepID=UPI000448EF0E|nr:ATP-binding protein [Pseudomonas sp. RIT288]EZP33974.1 ATPase AAA [Pseudomonas sp. RIT288]